MELCFLSLKRLTAEKSDSLGPKLSTRSFMGLFGGHYNEDMQVVVFLCTNKFRNFPVRAYLPLYELRFLSGCFGSTAKKPSLKLFHGAFFWFS